MRRANRAAGNLLILLNAASRKDQLPLPRIHIVPFCYTHLATAPRAQKNAAAYPTVQAAILHHDAATIRDRGALCIGSTPRHATFSRLSGSAAKAAPQLCLARAAWLHTARSIFVSEYCLLCGDMVALAAAVASFASIDPDLRCAVSASRLQPVPWRFLLRCLCANPRAETILLPFVWLPSQNDARTRGRRLQPKERLLTLLQHPFPSVALRRRT